VRVAIIDAGAVNADGTVLFVRKSKNGRNANNQHSARRNPDTDAKIEYVGTIYSDRMLVTAMGQLFDAWWDMSEPFQ
jgi:hypothetical protein